MLREHLDQTHDRASRTADTIEAHVDWIFRELLASEPAQVIDLGCGPGLYTERLAQRGCHCLGVDISPASIGHARRTAEERGSNCTYLLGDIESVDLGTDRDLAMLLFGEFNTFPRARAAPLLGRVARCLRPGGALLLEAHTFGAVVEEGDRDRRWYTATDGLFSARPHLVLHEHAWEPASATATTRFHVVDDAGEVHEFTDTLHALTDDEYRAALTAAGFESPTVHAHVGAFTDPAMLVVVARVPQG